MLFDHQEDVSVICTQGALEDVSVICTQGALEDVSVILQEVAHRYLTISA